MTTTTDSASLAPARVTARSTFINAMRSEWIKLRTVRSTMWSFVVFMAIMIGFCVLFCALTANRWNATGDGAMSMADKLTFDPFSASLAGHTMGSLAIGVLGALVVTAEYGTGTIRPTLMATPSRARVLLSKALVFALVTYVVVQITIVIAFLIGQAILGSTSGVPHVTLSSPEILPAIFASAIYLVLLALFSMGLGWIIRHTAGAVSAFVGVLFPLYLLLLALPSSYRQTIDKFMPLQIGLRSISTVHIDNSNYLPLWGGILVMAIYAVLALGIGLILLERRDA